MKKVIALFLIASILLLAGCSDSSAGNVFGDELLLGFKTSDHETYLNYIGDYIQKGKPLSNKIVTADHLFVLGTWETFSFEWGGDPKQSVNGQWYVYWLEAPGVLDRVPIRVEVYLQPEQAFVKRMIADKRTTGTLSKVDYVNSESMAQLQSREDSFNIIRNGVTYSYLFNGELTFILFEVKGILYCINIDGADYSSFKNICKDSVLGRLLSLDEATAKAAYNEIKSSLTK